MCRPKSQPPTTIWSRHSSSGSKRAGAGPLSFKGLVPIRLINLALPPSLKGFHTDQNKTYYARVFVRRRLGAQRP